MPRLAGSIVLWTAGVVVAAGTAVLPGTPALAASNAAGYVFANDATADNYLPPAASTYNSSGRPVRIGRLGVGVYRVVFDGLGGTGGVAHVTAHGWDSPAFCVLGSWWPTGTDEVLDVRCFRGGAPADARFVANYTRRVSAPASYMSYLLSTDPAPASAYTPAAVSRFDTHGAPPTVERLGPGRYRILDDTYDAAAPYSNAAQFAVTAVGSAVLCRVVDEAAEGMAPRGYLVGCADASGSPVDTRFSYTWVRGGNIVGASPKSFGTAWAGYLAPITGAVPVAIADTTGGPPSVEWLSAGLYRFMFPGLGAVWGGGHAQVQPMGGHLVQCTVAHWGSLASAVVVIAQCYDPLTGAPAEAQLISASFTS